MFSLRLRLELNFKKYPVSEFLTNRQTHDPDLIKLAFHTAAEEREEKKTQDIWHTSWGKKKKKTRFIPTNDHVAHDAEGLPTEKARWWFSGFLW